MEVREGLQLDSSKPVIPTEISRQSRNPDGYIFLLPHPEHTFNPETCPHFALKSRLQAFQRGKSPGSRKMYWGRPSVVSGDDSGLGKEIVLRRETSILSCLKIMFQQLTHN